MPAATRFKNNVLTTDVAASWTSKFNDNKTELEAVVGWHRSSFRQDPFDALAMPTPRQNLFFGDLGVLGGLGGESQRTINGCLDGGADDPYPLIRNCPDEGVGYAIGGRVSLRPPRSGAARASRRPSASSPSATTRSRPASTSRTTDCAHAAAPAAT